MKLVEGERLLPVDGIERLAVDGARKLLTAHLGQPRRAAGAAAAAAAATGGVCGEGPAAVRLLQRGGGVGVGDKVHGGVPSRGLRAAVGRLRLGGQAAERVAGGVHAPEGAAAADG